MGLKTAIWTLAILALAAAAAFYALTRPMLVVMGDLPARQAGKSNGETLFIVGDCASCHATPSQEDQKRLGGGLALRTPFGTFNVPNISSHPQYGIGAWSEADFINAMLRGVGRNGEHLYPAFPYTSYQHMALDDVRDLFGFLKTLPPEATPSAAHDLHFPFTIRRGIGLWKLRYLDGKPFEPDPSHSAEWNRGAYLVNGPGHCAECHSPRDVFGGIIPSQRFAGGPNPDGKGMVPNITQFALKDWSQKDIAFVLELGQTPDGDFVGSSMTAVVRNTAQLAPADRAAIATYIKSLPPIEGPKLSPKPSGPSKSN
jgi:mono/diheme cytochrome c family protein